MSDSGNSLGIRMNSELKEDWVKFCESKQITQSCALSYFMKKSVDEEKLPFTKDEIYMLESQSLNGTHVAKVSLRIKDRVLKQKFKNLCESYSLSMAGAVKLFFRKCIEQGDFPF